MAMLYPTVLRERERTLLTVFERWSYGPTRWILPLIPTVHKYGFQFRRNMKMSLAQTWRHHQSILAGDEVLVQVSCLLALQLSDVCPIWSNPASSQPHNTLWCWLETAFSWSNHMLFFTCLVNNRCRLTVKCLLMGPSQQCREKNNRKITRRINTQLVMITI